MKIKYFNLLFLSLFVTNLNSCENSDLKHIVERLGVELEGIPVNSESNEYPQKLSLINDIEKIWIENDYGCLHLYNTKKRLKAIFTYLYKNKSNEDDCMLVYKYIIQKGIALAPLLELVNKYEKSINEENIKHIKSIIKLMCINNPIVKNLVNHYLSVSIEQNDVKRIEFFIECGADSNRYK